MVERDGDKKIRILREILNPSVKCVGECSGASLDTSKIHVSQEYLIKALEEFGLNVVGVMREPLFDEIGNQVGETDDYLTEISFTEEDKQKVEQLLKKYEKELPKQKRPLIREKALELISQKIGNLDTGNNLVKFLRDCGVDKELIDYPNTKWRMIFDALVYLSRSEKREDIDALSKVIGEATHPLMMHNGNEAPAYVLRKQFDEYLQYDGGHIGFDNKDNAYEVFFLPDEDEQVEIMDEVYKEEEEWQKKRLEFLCKPENREKISSLKKAYQSLMNVVEAFCENPANPTSELNDAYLSLDGLVWGTISDLGLSGKEARNEYHDFNKYKRPFTNLFAAEKHYQEQKKELSWQKIRPEMNAMYGDIEELYREVNGSDILAEPDQQKKLNDIQLLLSNLKQKREIAKSKVRHQMRARAEAQSAPTTKIEITAMPPLEFREQKEVNTLHKTHLDSVQITYSDDEPEIKVGRKGIALPPYKNEHYFCQAVFEYKPKEPISWDIIYDKMMGHSIVNGGKKPEPIRENWQKVNDTMKRVNNRIKDILNTDDDLFSWSEKTVFRNY